MTRNKKDANIYLKVINAAFVTYEKSNDGTGRLLIKVATSQGEDICGFLFDKIETVDSMFKALERVRAEIEKSIPIHPMLKSNPQDPNVH